MTASFATIKSFYINVGGHPKEAVEELSLVPSGWWSLIEAISYKGV